MTTAVSCNCGEPIQRSIDGLVPASGASVFNP